MLHFYDNSEKLAVNCKICTWCQRNKQHDKIYQALLSLSHYLGLHSTVPGGGEPENGAAFLLVAQCYQVDIQSYYDHILVLE